MALDHLADNFYVVLLAYFAAFLPWTALTAFDYISPEWRKARHVRHAGYTNLLLCGFPALYIVFYIVIQIRNDTKEMFAAIVALIFALLYFLRTAWGLWQLHVFVTWASKSIQALQALGIDYRPQDVGERKDMRMQRKSKSRGQLKTEALSADEMADELLVSDELIENRLFHGNARCYLQFEDTDITTDSSHGHISLQRILSIPIRYVYYTVLRCCHARKSVPHVRRVPYEPEEVWLRWCVAFAAQGLGGWVKDFRVAREPDEVTSDLNNKQQYEIRRDYAASRVLATAGLELRLGRCVPLDEDSVVSKTELLRRVAESGFGLPFDAKQVNVMESAEKGYRPYALRLSGIMQQMPISFGKEIEGFDIEKVEWLAIFLNMGGEMLSKREAQTTKVKAKNIEMEEREFERLPHNDFAMENLRQQLGIGETFLGQVVEQRGVSSLCAFPLPESYFHLVSGKNRMVTKIGELIDCWLALMAGGQIRFMVEKDERWKERCIGPKTTETASCFNPDEACTDEIESKSNSVFTTHVRLEEARLAYQFGVPLQEFEHVEQTLTFMGHSLENLRTRLGQWLKGNEDVQARAWRPVLFRRGERKTTWEKIGDLSAELSETVCERGEKGVLKDRGVQSRLVWELQNVSQEGMRGADWRPSAIRAVALCLLSFPAIEMTRMEDGIREAEGHRRSTEAGEVEIKQGESCVTLSLEGGGDAQDQTGSIETVEFTITAMCAPQQTKLDVRLQYTCEHVHEVHVRLCRSANCAEGVFEWEWWRDAAMGRMEGLKRWQENHAMEAVEFYTSRPAIDSGLRTVDSAIRESGHAFVTWAGWGPFRKKHCRFEVESEKLLLEFVVTQQPGYLDAKKSHLTRDIARIIGRRCAVGYAEATRQSIRDGCLIVREALRSEDMRDVESSTAVSNQTVHIKDLILKAENLISSGPEHVGRAIFLLQVAALERNDFGALCTCVELLTKWGSTERYAGRTSNSREAAQMIKQFFHIKLHTSMKSTSTCGDDEFEKLLHLFAKLVVEQSFDGVIVDLFVRVLDCAIDMDVAGSVRKCHAWIRKAIVCSRKWNQLDTLASFWNSGVDIDGDMKSTGSKGDDIGKEAFFSDEQVTECDFLTYDLVGKTLLERMISEYATLFSREGIWVVLGTGRQGAPRFTNARKIQYAESQDENSSARAMMRLASLFWPRVRGLGCDARQGKQIYEVAIEEHEECAAMYNLGNMLRDGAEGVERNAVRSMELYERAIEESDHVSAMTNLGILLRDGAEGVERNAVRSKDLFERAIEEADHVDAMNNLALLFAEGGEGVERNTVLSMKLCERAIEKADDVDAMNNLALLLAEGGEGVERNAVRSLELYERAIEKDGDVTVIVMYNLANLLSEGAEGIERNAVRSIELYERVIEEADHVGAMTNLGILLRDGAEGVERNAVRSKELFERAIEEADHVDAMTNLGILLGRGAEGVRRNEVRSKELYERAIEKADDVDAMNNLALLLAEGGEGVERNAVRSLELYERAIEKGDDVIVMFNLSALLQNGAEGVERNAVRSVELYERAIEKGDHVGSMVCLGVLLQLGAEGVERNAVRSKELYELAIAKGEDVNAMRWLGVLLQLGAEGVERNAVRSKELYELAIAKGEDADAMFNLGVLLSDGAEGVARNAVRSVELYERAIEKGEAVNAMVNLANLLRQGADGVERNAVRSVELYERAIEKGDSVNAMGNLGLLLQQGAEGVERNVVRSVRLYERAVEKGSIPAMLCLGNLLQHGAQGVERNTVRSVELYEQAVEKGDNVNAMLNLGLLLQQGGEGVEQNAVRAVELYERAIEKGDAVNAMVNLGGLLQHGAEGVERNAVRSVELYERAIDKGDSVNAMLNLANLLQQGAKGVERNAERSMELFERAIKKRCYV